MKGRKCIYSVVVPLYNEELVINESYKRIKEVMDSTSEPYEIIFVNDGSRDRTSEMAKEICKKDKNVRLLSFSRNFGHQAAITAGMEYACGQAIIVIDADLQDPPEVILEMIKKWKEGFDVVYGQRSERQGESFFKKITAKIYYRLLKCLSDVDIPVDVGDFRLIDRKVCDALKKLPEKNRYVRGLISWLGFKQTSVKFVRKERYAGETKYPLKKMLKFAFDGITSFSYKPLKLWTYLGLIVFMSGFIYLAVIVCRKLFTSYAVPGWAIVAVIILITNGAVLISLGTVGGYISRIYDEAKGRPLYVLDEKMGFEEDEDGSNG
ncbi:MAG TPA: glycosyltransferase family 2 protein [Clostridiaceae bacterium]|nr:glycosyltransferase family 2 protein [Clostridiaceae bacterium]